MWKVRKKWVPENAACYLEFLTRMMAPQSKACSLVAQRPEQTYPYAVITPSIWQRNILRLLQPAYSSGLCARDYGIFSYPKKGNW